MSDPTARGEQHGLSYVMESAYGTTPGSPTMKKFRHVSCGLKATRVVMQAQESSGNRAEQDTRLGLKGAAGPVQSELVVGDHDDHVQMSLNGNAWPTAETLTASDISAEAADQSVNSVAAGFTFSVGDLVTISGFSNANNNGTFKVVTATTSKLTFASGSGITDESAGNSVTVERKVFCAGGTTELSMTVERLFPDITQYQKYPGTKINKMTLSVKPREIAKVTFDLISGKAAVPAITSLGTPAAHSGNSACDGLRGTWAMGGTATTKITGVDLSVEENEKPTEACGSMESEECIPGRRVVTGSFTFYFRDQTELQAFLAETEGSLTFTTQDPAGNAYVWTVPRLKYEDVDYPKNDDGPIIGTARFRGLLDPKTDTNLYVTKTTV